MLLTFIQNQMREKRQRKPKYQPAEIYSLVNEPRKRRIKKQEPHSRSDESPAKPDPIQEQVPPRTAPKKESMAKKGRSKKKIEEPMELDMENEDHQSPIEREEDEPAECEPKLSNLAKLSENYKEIKAAHEENISQLNYHKKEYQKLGQKVSQTNDNVHTKAKELKALSRKIYIEALENNKQEFLNSKTFTQPAQFKSFTRSMKRLVEAIKNCPYQDPLHNIKLLKITPEKVLVQKKATHARQHKKELTIKNYLTDFPYLTLSQQYLPLIQALIGTTKFTDNPSVEPIQQFPCLFIRKSSLSYSCIQTSLSFLYKICTQEEHGLAMQIHSLIQQNPQISDTIPQIIQQLLFKALTKIRFICLPEQNYQLRSFCFGDYIYINTYYPQRQILALGASTKGKQICIAYCVLNAIRVLPCYVQNSLVYALDKDSEDIGKILGEIKDRYDVGVKLEQMLKRGEGEFVCCSYEDYRNLEQEVPRLYDLGHYKDHNDCFVYHEEKKRRQKITSQIVNKYKDFQIGIKLDTKLGIKAPQNQPDQVAHNSDSDIPKQPREISLLDYDNQNQVGQERKSPDTPLGELDGNHGNRRSRRFR